MSYIVFRNDGGRTYYNNLGQCHRVDGPAMINAYFYNKNTKVFSKSWWLNDKLHRLDGPAIEQGLGKKYYYINGENIKCSSQQKFEKLLRLKVFW